MSLFFLEFLELIMVNTNNNTKIEVVKWKNYLRVGLSMYTYLLQ